MKAAYQNMYSARRRRYGPVWSGGPFRLTGHAITSIFERSFQRASAVSFIMASSLWRTGEKNARDTVLFFFFHFPKAAEAILQFNIIDREAVGILAGSGTAVSGRHPGFKDFQIINLCFCFDKV